MKKIYLFSFSFLFFFLSANAIAEVFEIPVTVQKELPSGFSKLSIEDFLSLSPSKIKKETGQRLTWKQTFVLKRAQKKITKELKKDMSGRGHKSQVTALVVALFFGFWGFHRFYLGYPAVGFLMLFTAGGCGILYLVDLIMVATGDLQPKHGYYDETLD